MGNNLKPLQHIGLLRLGGDLVGAVSAVQPLLASREPEVVVEVVRLMVLLNKFDDAIKYFQMLLSKDQIENHCEIELLYRLEAQVKGSVSPRYFAVRPASKADWIAHFWSDKIDKTYSPDIRSCQVDNFLGRIHFKFTNVCSSCATVHTIQLIGTLLIDKYYFCPRCFAKHEVTFEATSNFIRHRYANLLGKDVEAIDMKVIGLAQSINEVSSDAPPLVSYLNQDFIFMLSQIIVSSLLKKCDESEVR